MNRLLRGCKNLIIKNDNALLITCLVSSALSVMLLWGIYLSGYVKVRVFATQIIAILLGVTVALVISLIDYRLLARCWKLYIPVSVILVLLTYVVGIQRYSYVDDKAWLPIPFTTTTIQPSEILKFAFVLSFSLHLEKAGESINDLKTLLGLCLHGAVPVLMIVAQGDHGTAMVFAAIFVCMMFSAGLSLKYIGAAVMAAVVASPLVWFYVMDNDKRGRILTVFNPEADPTGIGWQQSLGLTAIGSGQVWGKGITSGGHQYIPEMHNDFVFAFAGEAIGFMGCVAIIALILLICILILIDARRAKDRLGRYICVGIFSYFAFQSIWTIGMCLSLLPVAGLTLPLFSAGGTSVVLTWVGIGLVLGVYRHSHRGLFEGHGD